MSEDRLSRIEDKVDKLVDAMTMLVRIDEKIASHQSGMKRFGVRLDNLEERVESIEVVMPLVKLLLANVNKVFISIVTLITAGIVASYFIF